MSNPNGRHEIQWDEASREAEKAAERVRWVQTAGYLDALGIQVGFLHELLPETGKARRLFEHLAETLGQLETVVRKRAELPPADEE